jgi:hypothetical protein
MTKSMPFERGIELARTKATIEFIETHKIAKNYLDFQLSTFLGYLIGKGEVGSVFVISKDCGFDSLVDFWKKREITICRQESIVQTEPMPHKVTVKKAAKTKARKAKTKKAVKAEETAEILQETVQSQTQIPGIENSETENPETKNQEKEKIENPGNEENVNQQKEDTAGTENIQPEKEEVPKTEDIQSEQEETARTERIQSENAETAKPENMQPEKADTARQPKKKPQKQQRPDLPEAYRKKVRAAVKPEKLAPSSYTSIYKAIVESTGKVELNNAMVKIFNTSKGGRIYGLIKNIYAEYQKDA